jgi:hypothetical protein
MATPGESTSGPGAGSDRVVPEIVGAPSLQGGIIVHARNVPPSSKQSQTDNWYVPSHCPVFLSKENQIGAIDSVVDVTADPAAHSNGLAGVSIDGLYDAVQQRNHFGSEGIGRFSIAVGGLCSVAAHPKDVELFGYGDLVYVKDTATKIDPLTDTGFKCCCRYGTTGEAHHLLGTFVSPVDSNGGMRVMLSISPKDRM